jgi:CheY-like chemotaxis protein
MRILIVEDSEISAGILDSNLKQRRYETVVAYSGTEALQLLEQYWDIALVLADIMMPGMDGLDFVRRIREDPKWQDLPVIICTSLADAEHVGQAARLGCKHYLLKPVDRVQLLMMVDKILSKERPIPVLEDRNKIMAKYGLNAESLDLIFKSFTQLVDEHIAALDAVPPDTIIPEGCFNLARLAEAGVTLGAERLLIPVRALQAKGAQATITSEERNTLLAELKWVRRALTSEPPQAQSPNLQPAPTEGQPAAALSKESTPPTTPQQ